jgi:hypothetical protein
MSWQRGWNEILDKMTVPITNLSADLEHRASVRACSRMGARGRVGLRSGGPGGRSGLVSGGLVSEMGSFFGELDDAANMLPDKGIANPRRATHHGRLHLP